MAGAEIRLQQEQRAGARNSKFQTRTACMLVLDIDYCPQCVAHAHQVRDLHSMVGRGARTRTYLLGRVRIRVYTNSKRYSSVGFLSLDSKPVLLA